MASEWTKEKIELLTKLWSSSLSTKEIGLKLDVTKNAVIGKARRLKLPRKTDENIKKEKKEKPIKQKEEVKIPSIIEANSSKKIVASIIFSNDNSNEKIEFDHVQLRQLKSNMCIWIEGDPDIYEVEFCGRPIVPNKPYCVDHCKLAFIKSLRPSKRLARELYTESDANEEALYLASKTDVEVEEED